MNKRYLANLDNAERNDLSELVKKNSIVPQKRTHAQVLLLTDCTMRGLASNVEAIANACQITLSTVANIRKRRVLECLDSPLNRKKQLRPSRPKIIAGENEAKVVAMC